MICFGSRNLNGELLLQYLELIGNKESCLRIDVVIWLVEQILELFEMVKKLETVGDSLPHVVDRMVALKELHEQGKCS